MKKINLSIKFFYLFIVLIMLFACTIPRIKVSKFLLTDTSVFKAKGKQGWQINQVITFGGYYTSKVKRGGTTTTSRKKAKQKLSFQQYTPDNKSSKVNTISKYHTYEGTIIPINNPENIWKFIINNPELSLSKDVDCGMIENENSNKILIRLVREFEGHKLPGYFKSFNLEKYYYGYEFIQNEMVIGTVSTISNGRVWIKNHLTPDQKLVLSSVFTALLLRHSIKEILEDSSD